MKATNPKIRKNIGLLKRDDNALALDDSEKACLMNSFFATVGQKLSDNLPPADDVKGATVVNAVNAVNARRLQFLVVKDTR